MFVFRTFVKNTLLYGKMLLKSEKKNILQISYLIFQMLQVAKYLICDLTFTISFFFICSKLNWLLFHLSGIFAYKEKVEISIWNIWIWRQSSEILNDIAPNALIPQCNDHNAIIVMLWCLETRDTTLLPIKYILNIWLMVKWVPTKKRTLFANFP